VRLRRRHRPSRPDFSCQQAVSLVAAYLDDALPRADRARLEAHMQDCEHCGEHLKQIQVTILVTGEIRAEDLDPVAREDLMDLYRRWRDDAPAR
jgi:anti-sigma factor RsiW